MLYNAPIKEINFIFDEVLDLDKYGALESFADISKDVRDQILNEMAKFCEQAILPLNAIGDKQGCEHLNNKVKTPKGFKEAYQKFIENGWPSVSADPKYGGQGLPNVFTTALSEMLTSSNMAWAMYFGLTHGAYNAILANGSEELKAKYLPKLIDGSFTGTMNLTEPHCGTDLGLINTKAMPNSDGSYSITGQKIFISAGEHDMSENIIHLVLARIEGAPNGTNGISLFLVPKILLNNDGNLGEANSLHCASIEEKMGIHGNATCTMNYEDAKGFLIGEENKGLAAMFIMMNEARLFVGLQGLGQSEIAYQNAANYAKERLQMRSLSGIKNKEGNADPIIFHPDVRRMLLDIKAFNEAARLLIYDAALKSDIAKYSEDEKVRIQANDYVSLITPVIKGYITDKAFQNCVNAQQVFGGHGFIEDWPMSQFVRDARIAMIYEGTNGIQALDLVGRKLSQNNGRAIKTYFAEIDNFIKENNSEALNPYIKGLEKAKEQLLDATMWLMQNSVNDFNNAGAASMDYLHIFGICSLAFMWTKIAKESINKDDNYYKTKLKTATYFMEKIAPEASAHLAKIKSGAKNMMDFELNEF